MKSDNTIKIDPKFLEHIRNQKTKEKHDWGLTKTRFAANALFDEMYGMLYDALIKANIEEIKKKVRENAEEVSGKSIDEIDEEYIQELVKHVFMTLPFKIPFSESSRSCVKKNLNLTYYDFFPKMRNNGTFELNEKYKDRNDKFNEILRKHLKNQVVVDLGAGSEDFLWGATLYNAKEYIAIDNPNGTGKESVGSRKVPIELEIFDIAFPKEFCKNKYISIDLLEGLYTKIQDNSSCFVICGVDESYGFKPEYVKLANKLIAEKTKVGGIVVCWGSEIGQKMPEENFELIENWGHSSWGVYVWLRKK